MFSILETTQPKNLIYVPNYKCRFGQRFLKVINFATVYTRSFVIILKYPMILFSVSNQEKNQILVYWKCVVFPLAAIQPIVLPIIFVFA